jgi:hypothetical protein
MKPWLTDDYENYNKSRNLYNEVLRMPFEEEFLWHARKDKETALTVESPEGIPTVTVGEVLNTREFTEEEIYSILYSALLMYHIGQLRYEYRYMDISLFESNIFPAYQDEIMEKSRNGLIEISCIHTCDYKTIMPKDLSKGAEFCNLVANITFLYENLLKEPLVNPKTGNTYTGFDTVNYPNFSEEMRKSVIRDMLQCEVFNYVLLNGLDNQTAQNIWNIYNWDVIVNTIYKMYLKEKENKK